jgi:hypothetical protein
MARGERQKKRTHKTNSTGMRGLQARQGNSNLQAETKSMPQPQGEAVAETDTENTKIKGGDKMRESFLDKIREHKTLIIQVAVVVAIAVIVCALWTSWQAVGKGEFNAAMTALEGEDARASASINTLGTSLNSRMNGVEAIAEAATGEVNIISATTTENSNAIQTLQTWAAGAEGRITTVEAHGSPPEGYLTGNTIGNYTLHARCSEAGNFTANVNLVYSTPVSLGNATTYDEAVQVFKVTINWTAPNVKPYVPVIAYNGTSWGVSQVWFNIGTFAMTANNETAVAILFGGLNSTYAPAFSYVEVYSVLK